VVGRPSRAHEVRRLILDGSADLFSRRGYRATSMNEIAAAVGLSKPTLYHYFHNKEEILVRLYEEVMSDAVDNAVEVSTAVGEPLEVLHRLLAYRVRTTCERQAIHKVFFEEEEELPAHLIESVIEQRRRYEDVYRVQVQRFLDAHPDAPEIDVTVFVNSCLGAANWVYKWYRPDGPRTPEQLGQQIATYALHPLG
jgi:AcrR family transcriptional regulator